MQGKNILLTGTAGFISSNFVPYFLIGGRNERTNLQMVNIICEILDKTYPVKDNPSLNLKPQHLTTYKSLITFLENRTRHDRRYAIDATKLENELGWKSDENFYTGIVKTIRWYLNKYGIYK